MQSTLTVYVTGRRVRKPGHPPAGPHGQKISQDTLAEMVGTIGSRINFFMNKFRKLGFIHYNGGLKVHNSLARVLEE